MTLSDKEWQCIQGAFMKPVYDAKDVKDFIKECEKNSKYSNGITGNAMSIPIYKLKELAGDALVGEKE